LKGIVASKLKTDRSDKARIPRAVYVISGTVFVLGTSEFGIAGLLPEISTELSVSLPRAGLLAVSASAFNVGATLGPSLGGLTVSACLGFRSPSAVGLALIAVATVLSLLSRALDHRTASAEQAVAADAQGADAFG
jgi:predicted MFS family arabinose efflux permease